MAAEPEVLVDTNILVYAYSPAEKAKQERCARALVELGDSGRGAISTQVLAEFYTAVTRGAYPIMNARFARERVVNYLSTWRVLAPGTSELQEALALVSRHSIHIFDALIWATARCNGLRFILTEDIPGANVIGQVTYWNPFEHADLP